MRLSSVLVFCLVLAFAGGGWLGAQPSFEIPDQASVSSEFTVTWTGTGNERDFISVDEPGWPESKYGTYVYARAAGSGKLRAPATPGSYVVRYHSADSGYPVLAQREITVIESTAELSIPAVDWRRRDPDRRLDRPRQRA